MNIKKTIASTLIAASVLGCTMISTGCDRHMYTNEEYDAVKKAGEKLASEYFEDELGYEVTYCHPEEICGKGRDFYLTTYVSGRYKVSEGVAYNYTVNIETGEIYTDEHLEEFTEIAADYIGETQDIDVLEVKISSALDNTESEYFENLCPEEYVFVSEFPVDMDATAFEDYIKNSNDRNPIAIGVTGKVANKFDLAKIDAKYLSELDDEYNMLFNLSLENDYEYFCGDMDYFFYEHFIMIEKDDLRLLVTDKTYSYMAGRDEDKVYEATVDEVMDNLIIEETENGLKFTGKKDTSTLRFKIVAFEGDSILDKDITVGKAQSELEWEEAEDGFMVSKNAFIFNSVISISD